MLLILWDCTIYSLYNYHVYRLDIYEFLIHQMASSVTLTASYCINSIFYLTAFTIYDAVLSPSLLCIYTCMASDFSGKFNIHFTWMWPRYSVIGINRWLKQVATDFSRIPNCPTCKYGKCTTVNGTVPPNSLFTRWHHLSH